MRQNGTDLVRRCATRGEGGRQGVGAGGAGVCHLSPCARLARSSLGGGGRDTECLAGLEWKGGERERDRGEEEGGGITEGPQEPPPLPIISEMIHILG